MNWQEIDRIISEIGQGPFRVQQFVQPDFDRMYMELHDGSGSLWLQWMLRAPWTRFHAGPPPRRTKGPRPRFEELLNARLRGARLDGITQWGQERILLMDLHLDGTDCRLCARLWNNAANLLLLDNEGVIQDCFFRRPRKQETSGSPFILPETRNTERPPEPTIPAWNGTPEEALPFNAWTASWFEAQERDEARNRMGTRIRKLLDDLSAGAEARIRRLETRIRHAGENASWKDMGDMVLAEAWRIPKGSTHVDMEDWRNPGRSIRIPLDPKLDGVANANQMYQRFQKDRDALAWLEDDLRLRKKEQDDLGELESRMDADLPLPELGKLLDQLESLADRGSKDAGPPDQELPGARFQVHGHLVMVGRNARESDSLLRRYVRGNDIWLHVRDFAGGYVFIRTLRGKSVPPDVLVDAAHLAAWYSKGKEESELDLYWTQVKYLRRAKDGPTGLVIPTQERNLHLRVEPERLRLLLGDSGR